MADRALDGHDLRLPSSQCVHRVHHLRPGCIQPIEEELQYWQVGIVRGPSEAKALSSALQEDYAEAMAP
jgi:hypothetical protein